MMVADGYFGEGGLIRREPIGAGTIRILIWVVVHRRVLWENAFSYT